MPELVLKIGDGANYEDGDVLAAFNRRRIRCCHAQMICWPRRNGAKLGGFLGSSEPLLEFMLAKRSRYKFERVSRTEMRRTDQIAMKSEILSDTPNAKGERIDVELFVERRLHSRKLPLFGSEGREIWYGGWTDSSAATVEVLWDEIERVTAFRRTEHDRWPMGVEDLKVHFAIAVDEFDDAAADSLVAPLTRNVTPTEENPDGIEVVKKRKQHIVWGDLPGLSAGTLSDIPDPSVSVDIRGAATFLRGDVLETKT